MSIKTLGLFRKVNLFLFFNLEVMLHKIRLNTFYLTAMTLTVQFQLMQIYSIQNLHYNEISFEYCTFYLLYKLALVLGYEISNIILTA